MARLVLALIVGLALLTWAASGVVQKTVSTWFERDVNSRAQLVLTGARESLAFAWNDPGNLRKQLEALARDERVMAVAACDADFTPRYSTPGFPEDFNCWTVGSRVRASDAANGVAEPQFHEWSTVATLPIGRVHVGAMPITSQGQSLGFAILVHDMSYIDRREAAARNFLLAVFGILAVMAFGLPPMLARRARDDWSLELRGLLRGEGKQSREFQPILRDLRELLGQMADEREDSAGVWTAERLKQILNRYLHGEKIVILSNREPYIHQHTEDGEIAVLHPASGLVTALEPVMRACSGVWIAHGSGDADRETVDFYDHVRVPPGEESYHIRRVWLSEEEQQGYYYGISNEGLWPLCHVAHTRPSFRTEDWRQYRAVNQKFANAVASEVDSIDPIVLVQDYHFALAPAMIRKHSPAATVIMFWHIPWPNAERMGICPWRDELLRGLLGSSILGFQTQLHCNNFLDSVDRYLETRIDREQNAVVMQGHRTLVRPYPISLEWPVRWAEMAPSPEECRAQVWRNLDLKPDALLGIGVDRLDYTKGIEERLLAVELLLERHPVFRGRFTFVQLAAPSRTKIDRYRELNESVERLSQRINERFGSPEYRPIILLRTHHEPPEVFRYFRAAHLCYVSSLHDGMNLVAKEFVAARTDLRGVLVLSEFTGAARELTEALIVNPYDLEASSEAMVTALTMPAEEQADRMRSMRSILRQFNVYRWAGKMLADAARLRNQDRVAERLAERSSFGQAV
ncbi:MAG: trehalose-6-phosphate synthase [Bryobacteraceae bacterium]